MRNFYESSDARKCPEGSRDFCNILVCWLMLGKGFAIMVAMIRFWIRVVAWKSTLYLLEIVKFVICCKKKALWLGRGDGFIVTTNRTTRTSNEKIHLIQSCWSLNFVTYCWEALPSVGVSTHSNWVVSIRHQVGIKFCTCPLCPKFAVDIYVTGSPEEP